MLSKAQYAKYPGEKTFFYLQLDCLTVGFGTLSRGQPKSTNADQCLFSYFDPKVNFHYFFRDY